MQIENIVVELLLGGYVLYTSIILFTYLYASIKVWFTYKPSKAFGDLYYLKPRVSIIIPAFNEEVSIVSSVSSILNQDYDNKEIIIINDGSQDRTADRIIDSFDLIEADVVVDAIVTLHGIQGSKVRSVYQNQNITLINVVNGGKALALNTGVAFANSDYILTVDADTVLVSNSISRMIESLRKDVSGASCFIGVLNKNEAKSTEPPSSLLPKIQWMEYTRSFILWRLANDKESATLVMPGAFCLIKKDYVIKAGGYNHNSLSEDMDLTMAIIKLGGKIQFVPEFLAWTEVPETLQSLTKQRVRWYRGGFQNLLKYRTMLFNRKYNKFVSFYMLPFLWFAEIIGTWVEVIGIITLLLMLYFNVPVDSQMLFYSFTFISISYLLFMIILLVFMSVRLKIKKVYRILPIILTELFTYHYFNLYWMINAHLNQYLGKKKNWNKFKRVGYN